MSQNGKANNILKLCSIVGLIFTAIFIFMGLIYILHGNIGLASLLSLVAIVPLYLLSLKLLDLKITKQNVKDLTLEIVMASGYATIAIIALPIIFHAINVDFGQKDNIKKAGIDKIQMVDSMINCYQLAATKKIERFNDSVSNAQKSYFLGGGRADKNILGNLLGRTSIDFSNYERSQSTASKKALIDAIAAAQEDKKQFLESKYNLKSTLTDFVAYKQLAMPVFVNWQILKISYYYNDVDIAFNKVYQAALTKMPDFKFQKPATEKIVIDSAFSSLINTSAIKLILIILFIALLNAIILLPYLMAERPVPDMERRQKGKPNEKPKPKGAVQI